METTETSVMTDVIMTSDQPTCHYCGNKGHWQSNCQDYKDKMRKENINRMKNIVEGHSFKRFGGENENCICRIDTRFDPFLQESVPGVFVCYYCEWADCSECKLEGSDIICVKDHN